MMRSLLEFSGRIITGVSLFLSLCLLTVLIVTHSGHHYW